MDFQCGKFLTCMQANLMPSQAGGSSLSVWFGYSGNVMKNGLHEHSAKTRSETSFSDKKYSVLSFFEPLGQWLQHSGRAGAKTREVVG